MEARVAALEKNVSDAATVAQTEEYVTKQLEIYLGTIHDIMNSRSHERRRDAGKKKSIRQFYGITYYPT